MTVPLRPPGPRVAFPMLGWVMAVQLLSCQSPVNLDGKGCPCLTGYVCCKSQNACLRKDQVCVDAGLWPVTTTATTPLPLDDVTVYAFSQVDTNGSQEGDIDDAQLWELKPDMVIRGWAQWGIYGTQSSDYQFSYIDRCHAQGIRFVGGATATILLPNQLGSEQDNLDPQQLTSRSAENMPLVRLDPDMNQLYRASLANPEVRRRLIGWGKLQIDGDGTHAGVDGLHFEEVNGGYQGASPQRIADGNEGFDQFHLADFNAYLLDKYPPGTNFAALFGMTADNTLRRDVPPGDLAANFSYWRYLARHGWSATPLAADNPLAAEWGHATVNRPLPGARTFVDAAEPYRYWKQIATELRDYASATRGRPLLLTAEGIYPFVDLQSVGLDDYNTDGEGRTPISYLPTTADRTHLDGARSLQKPFLHLKALSEQFAPGAPVVLFLDGAWPVYAKVLGETDRADFWRLYAAEAYANGLYFAFHLKSSVGKALAEKTATELGLMPLFKTLAGFYRGHADCYHGVEASTAVASTSLASAMIAVQDQPSGDPAAPLHRRLIHLVNHEYQPGAGIVPQDQVRVTVASDQRPSRVSLASPDLTPGLPDPALAFSYVDGQVEVTVPRLEAYDVVILWY